jgi:hypothetical protein
MCMLPIAWMVLGYSKHLCILQSVFTDSRKLTVWWQSISIIQTYHMLLFREIMVVNCDICSKHIDPMWKNVESPNFTRVVHLGIFGYGMVKICTVGMVSNDMTRLYKSRVPVCLGCHCLWVWCMELATYHPPDFKNFEVASRFLEDFCTHYLWKWLNKCNKMLEIDISL